MSVFMRRIALLVVCVSFALTACSPTLTPEQKEQLASLQRELAGLKTEVETTRADYARYSGGLIKSLVAVRLEVLKTNEALIQQRIHSLEGRVKTEVIVKTTAADPMRATALAKDIEEQRRKLAEAKANSERYSGGLVKAMAEVSVATLGNTVAMLEQERLKAVYGLVLPQPPIGLGVPAEMAPRTEPVPAPQANSAKDCLKIETFDSSVLSSNNTFTELAWKADIANSCQEAFNIRVVFKIYDKDEFELDSDNESLRIEGNSTGKARGKMLVSPPEKARRMARQGVSIGY